MERVLIREYPSPPPAHKIIPLKLLLLIKASPAFKEFVGWLVLRFTSLGFSVKAWVRNCLLEQKQCTSGYTTEKYNCPPLQPLAATAAQGQVESLSHPWWSVLTGPVFCRSCAGR